MVKRVLRSTRLHSIGVITYLNVPPRVEMPVGVTESTELWWNTTLVCEPSLPPVLMPFEKEINQTILLQLVVIRVPDRVKEVGERCDICRGVERSWFPDSTRKEQRVEEQEVGEETAPALDGVGDCIAPGERPGFEVKIIEEAHGGASSPQVRVRGLSCS